MGERDLPQHVQALQAATRGDYAAARHALAQVPDGPPPRLVRIDPQIFDHWSTRENDGWPNDPEFLVITPNPDEAAPAVHRAAQRFRRVTEHGRECADWESCEDYTPNTVDDVYLPDAGLVVSADTKGDLTTAMGAAMLRILADELVAEGVRALVTTPPADFDYNTPTWAAPTGSPSPGGCGPRAYFVARTVSIDIGDGRAYYDTGYRCADGSWTFDHSAAQTWPHDQSGAPAWPQASIDLVHALREEPRLPATGEINCFLLEI